MYDAAAETPDMEPALQGRRLLRSPSRKGFLARGRVADHDTPTPQPPLQTSAPCGSLGSSPKIRGEGENRESLEYSPGGKLLRRPQERVITELQRWVK